jgi:hypothetical protein
MALTETCSLVWASEATSYNEYFCARCGILLTLNDASDGFVHPQCNYCCEQRSIQQCAILYLKLLLDQSASPVQVRVPCERCRTNSLIDLKSELRSCTIVCATDGRDALLIDGFQRILLIMRPTTAPLLKLAEKLGAARAEVDARNVTSGTPIQFLSGTIEQGYCKICNRVDPPAVRKIVAVCERFGITYDTNSYQIRPHECLRCKQQIIVFRWKENQGFEQEEPPRPQPLSVQRRWFESCEDYYWVNCCPVCDAVQEDFSIFDEYFGPWY